MGGCVWVRVGVKFYYYQYTSCYSLYTDSVLISGGWNREVPLYTEVFLFVPLFPTFFPEYACNFPLDNSVGSKTGTSRL